MLLRVRVADSLDNRDSPYSLVVRCAFVRPEIRIVGLYSLAPRPYKSVMKAARFYNKGDIRVEDIDVPVPAKGEVLVEVEWAGICGTDLHEWTTGPVSIQTKDKPHPLTGGYVPVTMGHEFVGRVSWAPDDSELQVGQAVMVDPRLNCRSCHACQTNTSNLCDKWGFLGLSGGGGGGFSEIVAVQAKMCHVLPESVNIADAAVIEPLAVGRHALTVTGMTDFSKLSILVLGGGPIGSSILYNLRAQGAGMTIVSEPTAKRQEQTKELADHVMNPLLVNVADECRALTDGVGVDIVFDCAGIPAGLANGMDAVKKKGMYVNVAGWETPVCSGPRPVDSFAKCSQLVIPFLPFMMKEIDFRGSLAYDDNDFKDVVRDFIAGEYGIYIGICRSTEQGRQVPGSREDGYRANSARRYRIARVRPVDDKQGFSCQNLSDTKAGASEPLIR